VLVLPVVVPRPLNKVSWARSASTSSSHSAAFSPISTSSPTTRSDSKPCESLGGGCTEALSYFLVLRERPGLRAPGAGSRT